MNCPRTPFLLVVSSYPIPLCVLSVFFSMDFCLIDFQLSCFSHWRLYSCPQSGSSRFVQTGHNISTYRLSKHCSADAAKYLWIGKYIPVSTCARTSGFHLSIIPRYRSWTNTRTSTLISEIYLGFSYCSYIRSEIFQTHPSLPHIYPWAYTYSIGVSVDHRHCKTRWRIAQIKVFHLLACRLKIRLPR